MSVFMLKAHHGALEQGKDRAGPEEDDQPALPGEAAVDGLAVGRIRRIGLSRLPSARPPITTGGRQRGSVDSISAPVPFPSGTARSGERGQGVQPLGLRVLRLQFDDDQAVGNLPAFAGASPSSFAAGLLAAGNGPCVNLGGCLNRRVVLI